MGKIVVVMLCAGLLAGCQQAEPVPQVYAHRDTVWVRLKNGKVVAAGCIDSTGNYVVID